MIKRTIMKKKLIGVAVIAAIAVTAGWNFNQSKNEMKLNDIALANVEALASGEGSGNDKSLAQKNNGEYCCAKHEGNNCTQSPDC